MSLKYNFYSILLSICILLFASVGFPGEKDVVLYRTLSKYSKIIVGDNGNIRSLYFVRKDGSLAIESSIDLKQPWRPIVKYSPYMFLHLLFSDTPGKGLLIGLGGGNMVHFINHYLPAIKMDIVEIDPVVVKIAKKYFFIKEGKRNRIFSEDGFKFVERVKDAYDIIYTDAFLKNVKITDSTGVPISLKTRNYYMNLRRKLNQRGTAVFNLHDSDHLSSDIRFIKSFFPNVYVFIVPQSGNVIIVSSTLKHKFTMSELVKRAQILDKKFRMGFLFEELLSGMNLEY